LIIFCNQNDDNFHIMNFELKNILTLHSDTYDLQSTSSIIVRAYLMKKL
jgi:hypothetical protein